MTDKTQQRLNELERYAKILDLLVFYYMLRNKCGTMPSIIF